MTFTRLVDGATLEPLIVFGPIEHGRDVRTISRELLHSRSTRDTFIPATGTSGEYQLLFGSHADAVAASEFFVSASQYHYSGPTGAPGGSTGTWEWIDGYLVLVGETPDPSFETYFIVTGGRITITQKARKWELRVPYKEVV